MTTPTTTCTVCGKVRDVYKHMRADFPPDAAKKWMKKYCKTEGKPCEFRYQAGFQIVRRVQSQD